MESIKSTENKKCSFCGNNKRKLKGKDDLYICEVCVDVAQISFNIDIDGNPKTQQTQQTQQKQQNSYNIKNPKEYKKVLDEYVIGQEEPKKIIATALYNHIKRIQNPQLDLDKSNTLLIGKTGTGKTHLLETASKILDIPLVVVDTTSLTSSGYIGEDVNSVIERLYKASNGDISKTEKGIIFLDEIDKNRASLGGTNDKDVSGKAVQQELLKILEGTIVKIYTDGNSHNKQAGEPIEINTKDILFIAGGAFVGLKEKNTVSIKPFGGSKKDKESSIIQDFGLHQYLLDYGMIPEFLGRFTSIVEFEDLSLEMMKKIITEPKNSVINKVKNLFKTSNVNIEFSDALIEGIAKKAMELDTGARALKSILDNRLKDIMFNIDEYKDKTLLVDVDKESVI